MKKTKVILTFIGLIGIGFIAGFFTNRQLTISQIKKVRELGRPGGFQEHLLRTLQVSEEQREQLTPIIEGYSQRIGTLVREHRQRRRELIDSMHAEIKPLLSPDQIRRLEEFSQRFRSRSNKADHEHPVQREGERLYPENK